MAGEWGHNPLPWPRDGEWPGPPCYCGKTACIETFLSGPGMSADHERATGEWCDVPELVRRAGAGDPAAEATLARYEDRMARALAGVVNILDPDVIVLGGGMSNIDRLYVSVPRLWPAYVFSDRVDTPLRRARRTATPAGCAAPPGYGPNDRPLGGTTDLTTTSILLTEPIDGRVRCLRTTAASTSRDTTPAPNGCSRTTS